MITILKSWEDISLAYLASASGLRLVKEMPIPETREKVVRWNDRDYTFISLQFTKPSS